MSFSLVGELPELTDAIARLGELAQARGIAFTTADYGGVRTESDTTRILGYRDDDWAAAVKRDPSLASRTTKEKWRPIAPFGSSYHNYGAARDLMPTTWPSGKSSSWALEQLGELAPQVGLRWGGKFPVDRRDPPHFELAITLADAKSRWEKRVGAIAGVSLGIIIVAGLIVAALSGVFK